MLICGGVRAGACFIRAAGARFNLGVAGMAGEYFMPVGPVCRCGRCMLYIDRDHIVHFNATQI